jgi:hypothetical protein
MTSFYTIASAAHRRSIVWLTTASDFTKFGKLHLWTMLYLFYSALKREIGIQGLSARNELKHQEIMFTLRFYNGIE